MLHDIVLAFNRTSLELKRIAVKTILAGYSATFNRTSLELKPPSGTSSCTSCRLLIAPVWN